MRKEANIKTRYMLKNMTTPIRLQTLECYKCNYHVLPNDFCYRCGTMNYAPKKYEEDYHLVSYREYCDWILENFSDYFIWEVKDNRYYSIFLSLNEEDVKEFIQNVNIFHFEGKRRVAKRDLLSFLAVSRGKVYITKKEWEAIR